MLNRFEFGNYRGLDAVLLAAVSIAGVITVFIVCGTICVMMVKWAIAL